MKVLWLYVAAVWMVVCTAERGGSLRAAVEALQRRQRGHTRVPYEQPEYDNGETNANIENDYEDASFPKHRKYLIRFVGNDMVPYSGQFGFLDTPTINEENPKPKPLSSFRERSQHADNDRLRDVFMDRGEEVEEGESEEGKSRIYERPRTDDEPYAVLLDELWTKYKSNPSRNKNPENNSNGVVKLYKDKIVKKRYPYNWGPVAFKRKRSPDLDMDQSIIIDNEDNKNIGERLGPVNSNYNSYTVSGDDNNDDKDDMQEEYAIAFQPVDDDSLSDLADEDQYAYETVEKRFPVTKRSSGPYNFNSQKKRFASEQNKHDTKTFRNSLGTDPKIIRDLSKIFGDTENNIFKSPVKRSADEIETSHDAKPPMVVINHNHTEHYHNSTAVNVNGDHDDNDGHEHHIHSPQVLGKEITNKYEPDNDHIHSHDDGDQQHVHEREQKQAEKPIRIKKKSVDWSDYFGIDKRLKYSISNLNSLNEDRLKKQYFDTFNKEVIYPLNSDRKNNYAKRNYVQVKPNIEPDVRMNNDQSSVQDEKRNSESDNESKLDNIDKKLKNMEGLIVDEALRYSNIGEELDSKEEQEMKEKLLSRLAAAYSLEKMRKALKEFKQSLQMQKTSSGIQSSPDPSNTKYKRVVIKKEKVIMSNDIPTQTEHNNDFEDEQGAGHYLNGKIDEQLSEGYMGGSGRQITPVMSTASSLGSCPVLAKIVQRCRGVDLLAGDRGQLFLPLCSLHQICYLCEEAPPTTCDLVFLSEADSSCDGDMSCQRAARTTLMALRELHENLVDELDGECEASPCLLATLKLNIDWQKALSG